jgi:uncharacterized membrane protein
MDTGRFWEIDFARGVAVAMMIVFHLLFDLWYFKGISVAIDSGFWLIFARATLAMFLLLAGISLSLSYSRTKDRLKPSQLALKYIKRGSRIFLYGLIITAVTFIAFPQNAIWFGVLHLIGLSIILAIPLLARRRLNLFIGLMLIVFGSCLAAFTAKFPWLLWLGLAPQNFYTFDYVPILPWFGVVLVGIFLGKSLFGSKKQRKQLAHTEHICWLGRHSLLIYLLHQFLLVGLILLVL